MEQAQVIGPDANGEVEMTGHSVVVPGDTFSVWSDARSHQTRKVQVASTFKGDVVNLTATFRTLPSNLTYVDYAEVSVPAKQTDLKVQNFDYERHQPPGAAATATPAPPPHAPAAAAEPAAPAAAPAAGHVPIGTVVSVLPSGCVATEIRGKYLKCASGDYYRAAVQGNSLVYMATTP